jgi:hypothetical protein
MAVQSSATKALLRVVREEDVLKVRTIGDMLMFGDALELLSHSKAFREEVALVVANAPFDAVFLECPPVTASTLDTTPFEFVLVRASSLHPFAGGANADSSCFREHFTTDEADRASFHAHVISNLRGDAVLVVPQPSSASKAQWGHLVAFIRSAPKGDVHAYLQTVGTAAMGCVRRRAEAPTWMSTSGEGVPWLHTRLDSRPKYYTYEAYTHWPRHVE